MNRILLLALISLICLPGCEKMSDSSPLPETLVTEYNQGEMEIAIETAKGRIDEFIRVLESKVGDGFLVKVPIKGDEFTEHFWLDEVTYRDGKFSGVISNEPGRVKNVKYGQVWEVKKDEISDWMYTKGDKIHGGFTMEPLLSTMPREEADAFRSRLVR